MDQQLIHMHIKIQAALWYPIPLLILYFFAALPWLFLYSFMICLQPPIDFKFWENIGFSTLIIPGP